MISAKGTFTRLRFDIGVLDLNRRQMRSVGDVALASIKERVSRGVGADDQRMPPLSRGYARFKQRRTGRSLRDLRLTGDMLRNLSVDAQDGKVTIRLTSAVDRIKGFRNQEISPWLGISPTDERKVMAEIDKALAVNVRSMVKAA